MGIKTEKITEPEDVKVEDEIVENDHIGNPSGTYNMTGNVIGWSLDLLSDTITLNIMNRPDLGTKIIDKDSMTVEYRVDQPWYHSFLAKISADFTLKQLLLSGHATYLTGDPRPSHRWGRNKYENVIITTW
jgi:hypothetical protein